MPQRIGQHAFTFDNSSTYMGVWRCGKAHGHSTETGANGSYIYEGAWCNSKEHGQGTKTFFVQKYRSVRAATILVSGSRYEGMLYDCKRHGHGMQTYVSGDTRASVVTTRNMGRAETYSGNRDLCQREQIRGRVVRWQAECTRHLCLAERLQVRGCVVEGQNARAGHLY